MNLNSIHQILTIVNTPPVAKSSYYDLESDRKTSYKVDPLLCSVIFHRKNKAYGLSSTDEKEATPEDYEQTEKIREYYAKKYFWNSLKSDRPQSEFRANAMRLLAITDDWQITDKEAGFFVKLPCFYAEDTVYDKFRATVTTDKETYIRKGSSASVAVKLEFLAKTFRWQRVKRVSYWFKDSNNKLYSYTTMDGHPFNSLFEEKIQTPQTFEFSYGIDNITDMWYNSMKSFTIIKEQNA